MRYFLDTEFIEDGKTIDLISIGIVCEDGREYYAQCADATFTNANDWVARNVLIHLEHYDMVKHKRSCKRVERTNETDIFPLGNRCSKDCLWRSRAELDREIRAFVASQTERHDKPEFWGYYADYDWVVLCQLFGRMLDLPKGWPMYCMDLKQWCKQLGDPKLPEQTSTEHNALEDARWNKQVWEFLKSRSLA